MKKLFAVLMTGAVACCAVSCNDDKANNNFFVVQPGSTGDATTAWVQDAYLKASNSDVSDGFGWSVAVSGSYMAVASPNEESNQTTITNTDGAASANNDLQSGAVYVFKKDASGNWIQDAYLKASNPGPFNQFGYSLAMSGDTIVVGSNFEKSNQTSITNTDGDASTDTSLASAGAAYVFRKDASGSWIQDAYLKASNTGENDNFGVSVAVDGDTIVVGSHNEDSSATGITNGDGSHSDPGIADNSGAVYVFKKDGSGNWIQDAYLKASTTDAGDYFGGSVAVSGDIVVVGASAEESIQTGITNTDGTASADDTSDYSGAAYVFKKDGSGNWSQDAYLKASNTGEYDMFGGCVAVSGNTIVVGAQYEGGQSTINNSTGHPTVAESNNELSNSGAVYVFRKDAGNNWFQDAYLKAPNAGANDYFGSAVAVDGDTIGVTANYEDSGQSVVTTIDGIAYDDDSMEDSGAAYVFRKDASGNWVQFAYLKASNNAASMYFGKSIAVNGSTIVIGANYENSSDRGIINTDGHPTAAQSNAGAAYSGAAYVFTFK